MVDQVSPPASWPWGFAFSLLREYDIWSKSAIKHSAYRSMPLTIRSDRVKFTRNWKIGFPLRTFVQSPIADPMGDYSTWLRRLIKEHSWTSWGPRSHHTKSLGGAEAWRCGWQSKMSSKREGGAILSLYSGEEEGFTMRRAVKDLFGDTRKVIQVGLLNGQKWNTLERSL